MTHIVKIFNNLVRKTLFKLQNKTNNKLRISNFNKCLIVLISLLFSYLFYLLTPLLYDKEWVQNSIESKFFKEFKINLSTSSNISYRILPAPHFLVKNSKISLYEDKNQKFIADVRNTKIFLSQKNFFDKEKMSLRKIIIDKANFFLFKSDIKMLNDFSNNQFSNKEIKINNSNIFFKNNLDEIVSIVKVNKAFIFFDNEKLLNLFNLKGATFGVPFIIDLKIKNDSVVNKKMTFEAKHLKLNIFNESITKDNAPNTGNNIISFSKSKIKTIYTKQEKSITFKSNDARLNNYKIDYNGKLSINPFDLDLVINLNDYKISQLLYLNPIFEEFIKSELLFNENLNLNTSIFAKTNAIGEIFHNAKINFNIVNGKPNLDNTILVNDKIGLLELSNSSLFFRNGKLTLNTDILITIEDSKYLFSFLNTNKRSRKEIKNILVNLDYDFLSNQIKFNNVKVDNNEVSNQFLNVIEDFNNNESNNMIKSRRLLNKLFDIYAG